MKQLIIGLHGQRGVGKDTIADQLCKAHGFTRLAFADQVKGDLCAMFGVPRQWFDDRKLKEQSEGLLAIHCCDDDQFRDWFAAQYDNDKVDAALAEPRSPRWLMQTYGTDYRRAQSNTYWVRRLIDKLTQVRGNVVVTDIRFNNEVSALVDYCECLTGTDLQLWQVLRTNNPHFIKGSHISDQPVTYAFDRTILNGGTLNQLLRKTSRTLTLAMRGE